MPGQRSASAQAGQDAHSEAAATDSERKQAFRRALTAARLEADLTQAALATKLGTTQSAVARLESGGVTPTLETLCRLADLLSLRFEIAPEQGLTVQRLPQRGLTLNDLQAHREEILEIAARHGAANVRVFGSVARGEADKASDVDILIDIPTPPSGFAYFGLLGDLGEEFGEILGRKVDVLDSAHLGRIRERVLAEAVAI